jgi:hypothetical protein
MTMVVVAESRARRAPVTFDEARDALRELGRATRADLAEALGCSKPVADDLMRRLIGMEAARDTGTFAPARGGRQGRPSRVFEFAPWTDAVVEVPAVPPAVELQSGFALPDLKVEMKPVKRIRTPLVPIDLPQPTPKPHHRKEKPSNGHKVRRRKGRGGVDEMLRVADELGYTIEETKKHYRFRKPGHELVFGAKNPSDWRTVKNVVSLLNRAA